MKTTPRDFLRDLLIKIVLTLIVVSIFAFFSIHISRNYIPKELQTIYVFFHYLICLFIGIFVDVIYHRWKKKNNEET